MEKSRPTKRLQEASPTVGDSFLATTVNPASTLFERLDCKTLISERLVGRNGSDTTDDLTAESGDRAITVATIPPLHDDSLLNGHNPRSGSATGPTAAEFIDDDGSGIPELLQKRQMQSDGLDDIMRDHASKARDRSSFPPQRAERDSAGLLQIATNVPELSGFKQSVHHYNTSEDINADFAALSSTPRGQEQRVFNRNHMQSPESLHRTVKADSPDDRISSLPPLINFRPPTFESGQVGSVHHRNQPNTGRHSDDEEEEIQRLRQKIQLLTQQANISQEARGRVLVQILQEGMHHSLANEPDHIDNESSALKRSSVFERAGEEVVRTPEVEAAAKQHFTGSPSAQRAAERSRVIKTRSNDATSSLQHAAVYAVGDTRRASSKSSSPPSAIANDPQVKDVLLHQNAQPSPTQAATTQAAREQNAGAGIRQLCRIFCCPPTPGAIASKLAFVPPEPSYDMVPKSIENSRTERDATIRAHLKAASHAAVGAVAASTVAKKLSSSATGLSTNTAASATNTPKVERCDGDAARALVKGSSSTLSSTVSIPDTVQQIDSGAGGNGDGGVDTQSHAYKRKKRTQPTQTGQISSSITQPEVDENISPAAAAPLESVRDSYYLCLGGNFLEWTWGVHELQNNVEMFYAPTARGNKVACMYVRTAPEAEFTLLFSHGNAVDIGQMVPFYWSLGDRFRVNICAYDYSGYGKSSGKPSERNLYADIDGAWQAIRERYNLTEDQVILYGQSIGTVPTVDLASRNQNFAGVILHGPLASGLRIAFPETRRSCFFDVFRSIDKVHKINVPTLVIHGTDDEVIPLSNALALYEKLPYAVEPLFVEGGGHNDIELYAAYYLRLQQFIREEVLPFKQSRRRQAQQQQQQKDLSSSTSGRAKDITIDNAEVTATTSTTTASKG